MWFLCLRMSKNVPIFSLIACALEVWLIADLYIAIR